jgi:hypothetical protein
MTHHKENTTHERETEGEEKQVHIEPSESPTAKTGDPGRTPGKAEGEDDESATK